MSNTPCLVPLPVWHPMHPVPAAQAANKLACLTPALNPLWLTMHSAPCQRTPNADRAHACCRPASRCPRSTAACRAPSRPAGPSAPSFAPWWPSGSSPAPRGGCWCPRAPLWALICCCWWPCSSSPCRTSASAMGARVLHAVICGCGIAAHVSCTAGLVMGLVCCMLSSRLAA